LNGESVILSYTYEQSAIFITRPSTQKDHRSNDHLMDALDKTGVISTWKPANAEVDLRAKNCVEAICCPPNSLLVMGGHYQGQMIHETLPHKLCMMVYDHVQGKVSVDDLKKDLCSDDMGCLTYLMAAPNWEETVRDYGRRQKEIGPFKGRTALTIRHVSNHDMTCPRTSKKWEEEEEKDRPAEGSSDTLPSAQTSKKWEEEGLPAEGSNDTLPPAQTAQVTGPHRPPFPYPCVFPPPRLPPPLPTREETRGVKRKAEAEGTTMRTEETAKPAVTGDVKQAAEQTAEQTAEVAARKAAAEQAAAREEAARKAQDDEKQAREEKQRQAQVEKESAWRHLALDQLRTLKDAARRQLHSFFGPTGAVTGEIDIAVNRDRILEKAMAVRTQIDALPQFLVDEEKHGIVETQTMLTGLIGHLQMAQETSALTAALMDECGNISCVLRAPANNMAVTEAGVVKIMLKCERLKYNQPPKP
jgi:flagellar biosynthesis GTPase FlhF